MGISRTGRPDTSFIAGELDYIAKFAIHKAKKLEEELWSVVGVGELTDTTEATLFRLGIPSGPASSRAGETTKTGTQVPVFYLSGSLGLRSQARMSGSDPPVPGGRQHVDGRNRGGCRCPAQGGCGGRPSPSRR